MRTPTRPAPGAGASAHAGVGPGCLLPGLARWQAGSLSLGRAGGDTPEAGSRARSHAPWGLAPLCPRARLLVADRHAVLRPPTLVPPRRVRLTDAAVRPGCPRHCRRRVRPAGYAGKPGGGDGDPVSLASRGREAQGRTCRIRSLIWVAYVCLSHACQAFSIKKIAHSSGR